MKKIDKVVDKHVKSATINDRIVSDEALLREDLSIDSLKMVSTFSNIIRELNISIIEFSNDELLGIKTVSDLKVLFRSKLEAGSANK
jgi:hypothetical protein